MSGTTFLHFINNSFVASTPERYFDKHSPVDGSLLGSIAEGAPGYFFLDIQPDQLAGFEILVRAIPQARMSDVPMLRGRITPIVATTSQISLVECLAAGMDDLMPKPFTVENLKSMVMKWIG